MLEKSKEPTIKCKRSEELHARVPAPPPSTVSESTIGPGDSASQVAARREQSGLETLKEILKRQGIETNHLEISGLESPNEINKFAVPTENR